MKVYTVLADGEPIACPDTEDDARDWANRARRWNGVSRVTIEATERDEPGAYEGMTLGQMIAEGSKATWTVIYDSETEELAA